VMVSNAEPNFVASSLLPGHNGYMPWFAKGLRDDSRSRFAGMFSIGLDAALVHRLLSMDGAVERGYQLSAFCPARRWAKDHTVTASTTSTIAPPTRLITPNRSSAIPPHSCPMALPSVNAIVVMDWRRA
jgi:hypothetical protein